MCASVLKVWMPSLLFMKVLPVVLILFVLTLMVVVTVLEEPLPIMFLQVMPLSFLASLMRLKKLSVPLTLRPTHLTQFVSLATGET